MTEHEECELRDALVLVANALGMDESEAFRDPMKFAVRAGMMIYGLRQRAHEWPQPPRAA